MERQMRGLPTRNREHRGALAAFKPWLLVALCWGVGLVWLLFVTI
jgi:hypothetical protein